MNKQIRQIYWERNSDFYLTAKTTKYSITHSKKGPRLKIRKIITTRKKRNQTCSKVSTTTKIMKMDSHLEVASK
jgi:hypothetical protein